jgi:hypothetical protein
MVLPEAEQHISCNLSMKEMEKELIKINGDRRLIKWLCA